jgi:hypothetical protein
MAIDETPFCKTWASWTERAQHIFVLHLKPAPGLSSLQHVVPFLQVFSTPVLESNTELPTPSPSPICRSQYGERSNQRVGLKEV